MTRPIMIYYTGIGADTSGVHTKKRFLEIMRINFVEDTTMYRIHDINDYNPDILNNYSYAEWLEWYGAEETNYQ